MKKLLTAILCITVIFSMTVTAFGAQSSTASTDPEQGDSSSFGLGDLGDALSSLLHDLADAVPEVVDSVEAVLPEIVSGIQNAISEGTEGAQSVIDTISGQIGSFSGESEDVLPGADKNSQDVIDDSTKETLQDLAGQITAALGGAMVSGEDAAAGTDGAVSEEGTDAEPVMITGGWSINTEFKKQLSKEEEEIFQKAESTLAGGAYKPVAVIATQVVAGTNYAYLCQGAPEKEGQEGGWYIVALYQDLQGNVTTMSIRYIDLADIKIMGNIYNPDFAGAWTANVPEEDTPVLPEEAQKAFDAATAEYVGVDYSPIALLGTQLVAGLNYKVLCYGTLVTREPVTSWYVVDIYQDLQDNCSISDVQLFDLSEYISYGEEEVVDY